jgi:hypothetical protein
LLSEGRKSEQRESENEEQERTGQLYHFRVPLFPRPDRTKCNEDISQGLDGNRSPL